MSADSRFNLHPEMKPLLEAKQSLAATTNVSVQRNDWNSYDAALRRDYPADMVIRDERLTVPRLDGKTKLEVRSYRSGRAPKQSPCILYIHGGAFIKGSIESGDPIAWGIADEVGCVVYSLNYSLAPDRPFPEGLEDCYALVCFLAEQGADFGIDPGRIALWGDSAGGNLAASVCMLARDRSGPRILAQALNYSCLTDELTSPSYALYADAPVTTASMDRAWTLYLGDRRPTSDGYAAPLKAANLANLPPAHIHYAEVDCLADDSVRYAEALAAAGNHVELAVAERMIHGYLRTRFCGPASAAEFRKPCKFLKEILFDRP
jgi:acetyl esterase